MNIVLSRLGVLESLARRWSLSQNIFFRYRLDP